MDNQVSFNINNPICHSCQNELSCFNDYNFHDIQIKLFQKLNPTFQIHKDFTWRNKHGIFLIKSFLYESFYCKCSECDAINMLRIPWLNTEPNYQPIKKLKTKINQELKQKCCGYYPHLAGLI